MQAGQFFMGCRRCRKYVLVTALVQGNCPVGGIENLLKLTRSQAGGEPGREIGFNPFRKKQGNGR